MRSDLPVRRYRLLKEISINLSSLGIPLSFLSGYLFGTNCWLAGSLVLGFYFVLDNISSRLWFKVLEFMFRKRE